MASFFQHVLLTPAHKQTLIYPASVSSESESFQNYNCPSIRLPQQPARMALLWMEPCWMLYCQRLYTWRRGVSHYSQSLIRLMHCLTNQRVHTTPAHLHLFTHYCMKLQRLFLLYKNNIFDDFFYFKCANYFFLINPDSGIILQLSLGITERKSLLCMFKKEVLYL